MSDSSGYTPPRVWKWDKESGGRFASINRPISGPTHEKDLPVGEHPLQLYSLATPNGVKVTVLLEELLAIGKTGAEYDAWLVDINAWDPSRGLACYLPEHGAIGPGKFVACLAYLHGGGVFPGFRARLDLRSRRRCGPFSHLHSWAMGAMTTD
jgi:hypothetical protein